MHPSQPLLAAHPSIAGRAFSRRWLTALLAPILLSACAATVHPAAESMKQDALVTAALTKAAAGDTAAALQLLETANKHSPRNPDVLYWRGKMLSSTTSIGFTDVPRNLLAWHLLSRGAEVDPDNPRYFLEMGRIRLRTPLLRIEAERLFRKALDVAERSKSPKALAEVCFELGQVKERRYETSRDRYHLNTPGVFFDPDQALEGPIAQVYEKEFLSQSSHPIDRAGFTDRSEAEEYYRRGLAALPTSEDNAIGLMRLLYYQQRYQEMRDVANPLLNSPTTAARVSMTAALAEYKLARLTNARVLFEDGIRRMPVAQREDELGLQRITRVSDAARYTALTDADRARTDSAHWEGADPLLSTSENEGRLEFLARLAYVDMRFSDTDMRQIGWRTDRGLVIIRYGEPPVVAAFGASSDADPPDGASRTITVWYYPRTKLQFVFMGPPAMNYATFAGNFRGYAEQMREDAPFLLDNIPSALNIDTIPVQIARLHGRTASTLKMLVAASVNARNMYAKSEIDAGALELSLRMGKSGYLRLVAADTQHIKLPAPAELSKLWIKEVPTSDYRVRVEARDAAVASAAARSQMDVAALPFTNADLSLSDVVIGERESAAAESMRGFEESGLRARGGVTLRKREPFSIYWESYGLKPNADGRVGGSVRVAITLLDIDRSKSSQPRLLLGALADLVGVTRLGDQTLGAEYKFSEVVANRDRIPHTQSLNLSDAPSGRYRLEVFVTDEVTKKVAHTERILYVRD
ncbi:MAG: GWxTD domain-containing protein [Gemmatimonadota bacterium]|nr:GWxTD domain-containing protein [Gemmatimonadota bacterium]